MEIVSPVPCFRVMDEPVSGHFIIRSANIGIEGFHIYLLSMLKSFKLLVIVIVRSLKSRQQLGLENLLLRHQLIILQRTHKKPRLQNTD